VGEKLTETKSFVGCVLVTVSCTANTMKLFDAIGLALPSVTNGTKPNFWLVLRMRPFQI